MSNTGQVITIRRVDSTNEDFIQLVQKLDAELAVLDGDEHAFYHTLNAIDAIKNVIVLYDRNVPVACGAFKAFAPAVVEIKRMYVMPDKRNAGLASKVLAALEEWATESGITSCVLETGKRQPDAIRLYTKNGYKQIENFGKYAGIENSVCFAKSL